MFVTLTLVTAAEAEKPALLDAAAVYARQSMTAESGCRRIDVLTDETAADRIILFAVFEDADAFEDHCGTEHARRFEDACERHAEARQAMHLKPHLVHGGPTHAPEV